jgi:DNA-binding NarL/FixJ family response regulator
MTLRARDAETRAAPTGAEPTELCRHDPDQVVVAERAWLARELHDIVGHGLSPMVLQLVAVGGNLERGDVRAARQRLSRLEQSARETLAETRRLVHVLDPVDGYRVPATFPLPGAGAVIRVVIVDDDVLERDGLRAIAEVEDGIEVVGEASDGAEAVRLVEDGRPDVVLMDLQMPGMDGVEATRRILSSADPPRVVVLTTFASHEYVHEAMRVGASAFLLKDIRRGQLIATIRAVVGDETLAGPPLGLAALTEREVEVMSRVAAGRSNAEIAGELFLAETTVKTHVARILSKLHLRDRVQIVVLAYECGLVRAAGTAAPDGDHRRSG